MERNHETPQDRQDRINIDAQSFGSRLVLKRVCKSYYQTDLKTGGVQEAQLQHQKRTQGTKPDAGAAGATGPEGRQQPSRAG